MSQPYIRFDDQSFDPKVITPITHTLADHPLFQLDALRELCLRLPAKQVRFHATTARASSDFEKALTEHKHTMTVEDAVADIETSGSWIALHNAQSDKVYKALLDEVLDDVERRIGPKDPGMFNRAFWIFIQSPGSETPFHLDHEQNFLMQIRGKKTAYVWDPKTCVTDLGLEVFHTESSRREVRYQESFLPLGVKFDLEPGNGAYMPFTSPHMVSNPDNVAITISMTYCTAATRRAETIHRANAALRKRGVKPLSVGQAPARDAVKHAVFNSFIAARARMKGEDLSVPVWARY